MGPVTSLAQATTVLCMPRTGPFGPLPRDAIHRCAMRWTDNCSGVPFAPFSQVELRLSARSQPSPEDRATQQTMRPSCLRVPMDDGVQVASKGRMRCAHRPSSMTLARTLSPPRPIHVWMRWRKKRWSTTKTRCDRKKMESSVGRISVRRSPAVTEGARCGLVSSPHLPLSRLALCSASSSASLRA